MKTAIVLLATACMLILLVLACGGISDDEACDKYKSLCNSSSTTDGGLSVTTKASCDPAGFDKLDNADDVKECIDKAPNCDEATKCLLTGKAK